MKVIETKVETVDAGQWRTLARSFDDYNYRQLWEYGQACAHRRNAVSEHVRIHDNGRTLALADVRIKQMGTLGGIAYIDGGPLVRGNDEDATQRLRVALEALIEEYVNHRKLLLRIQPPLGAPRWNRQAAEVFESAGFQVNSEAKPYRTFLIDLHRDEEALMGGLAKKWRYNLRKAMKDDFVLRTGCEDELFDEFCRLHDRFREAKGFEVPLEPAFYADVQRRLPLRDRMVVSLAEKDGQVIAGHVYSALGDTAVNLFRAMTPEAAKTQVSYLLQWNAVAAAAARGFGCYDMGGIDPEGNPGVYSFKKGLGGEETAAAGPFEYGSDSLRGLLVHGAEKLYRKIRS